MDRYLGPAQAFDGGVATLSERDRLYYTVPVQELCTFCGLPIRYVAGKHDGNYVVAVFIDNVPSWCHQQCRIEAKGDASPAMARHAKRPKCSRCGKKWKDHQHDNDGEGRPCMDGKGMYTSEPIRSVA